MARGGEAWAARHLVLMRSDPGVGPDALRQMMIVFKGRVGYDPTKLFDSVKGVGRRALTGRGTGTVQLRMSRSSVPRPRAGLPRDARTRFR